MANKNHIFTVNKIEVVTKNSDLPEHFLIYLNQLQDDLSMFEGEDLWKIEMDKISEILSKHQWISEYRIYRRFPQTLRIEYEITKSMALFLNSKGKLFVINEKSQVLPPIEIKKAPLLPVIQETKILKDELLRKRVVDVLKQIPQEGSLTLRSISEVSLGKNNELFLKHLGSKSLIKIGSSDLDIKSARVAKVLDYLDNNNLQWRVIDADFSKKVLVKLRNDR